MFIISLIILAILIPTISYILVNHNKRKFKAEDGYGLGTGRRVILFNDPESLLIIKELFHNNEFWDLIGSSEKDSIKMEHIAKEIYRYQIWHKNGGKTGLFR